MSSLKVERYAKNFERDEEEAAAIKRFKSEEHLNSNEFVVRDEKRNFTSLLMASFSAITYSQVELSQFSF